MCLYQLRPMLGDFTSMYVETQNCLELFCLCRYDCGKNAMKSAQYYPQPTNGTRSWDTMKYVISDLANSLLSISLRSPWVRLG